MNSPVHVIFGTGPVGCWTARSLREAGFDVRAVNRSGARPALLPHDVEVVAADASDASRAREATAGASVVYHAASPAYHQWPERFPPLQAAVLGAAARAGARFVSIENLYMYDASAPIHEGSQVSPVTRKGAVRRRLADEVMRAHERGDVQATALRASDYYGPGVTDSAFGERLVGSLVSGKPAQVVGSVSMPHSVAYIEDVARAAVVLGTRDEALGSVWIAPHDDAPTQGEFVEEAARHLGVPARMRVMGALMMRIGGLFVPAARESVEMMYQFTEPFLVDSSRIERAFGLEPTPLATGIERTVAWYRRRGTRDDAGPTPHRLR
jgi:nucleoside-diphosphate-sugar epimerase